MKKQIITMSMVALMAMVIATSADILTFDDISTGTIADGYGGFDWDQFSVGNHGTGIGGYGNAAVSGDQYAYNIWANVATVSDTTFNFVGAYFTGAWNNNLNIQIFGKLDGSTIYDQTIIVDTSSATWNTLEFIGIDELVFSSYGGTPDPLYTDIGLGEHFAMDNFTYVIPEPASIAMAGVVSGFGLFIRRKFIA